MLWVLLLAAAAMAVAYYRWSRRRLYQLAREIPSGIKTYPIIGHAYLFVGNSEDRMMALQKIGQISNQQGGFSHAWLAHQFCISVTDAKAIEVVSKACLEKNEFTVRFIRMMVGNGSIFAPVNIWQPRRKIMAPFFNLKQLMNMVKVFDEQSAIMTKLMRVEAGKGDFSIWKYMTTFTFDTVCETATGYKSSSQENRDHFALRSVDVVSAMIAERFLQPWLHSDFVYERLPAYKEFLKQRQLFHNFIDEIIQKKRKEFAAVEPKDRDGYKTGRTSFLDFIIQSSGGDEKGYSDIELREELTVMIIAGNDTSAVGSSFTAVMLSRHPDVQDKVYRELKEVFRDSDRAVTPEDLPQLKYLEAVIKESLRLYPPVPLVSRNIHNDLVLPSGTTLVDGTCMAINIWGTHRNPAYWGADAGQFRPERFLEGPLSHPAQFIPFSYSVRGCIGATYAMMSMKTALANLLRRYRLLPPAGAGAAELRQPLRVKFDIMMKAVDNFVVRVEDRNKII